MISKENIKWYRSHVDKKELFELTKKQNIRPLIHMIVQLMFSALTGTATFLAWKYLSWPFWVATLYIHCAFINFLGPTGTFHELTHRTVFKNKRLNEFFIRLFSFITWSNFFKFRESHLKQHHPYTVIKGFDHEVVLPEIIRKRDIPFCLTVAIYSINHMGGIFRLIGDYLQYSLGIIHSEQDNRLFPKANKKLRRQLFNWCRIVLIGHIILAAAFIYFDLWILLFIVTFAKVIANGYSLLFTFTQHIGLKPDVIDYRINSRTIKLGPIMSFFYCNMNYHIEHHMYAAVPYYNLPKLHEAIMSIPHSLNSCNWRV